MSSPIENTAKLHKRTPILIFCYISAWILDRTRKFVPKFYSLLHALDSIRRFRFKNLWQ